MSVPIQDPNAGPPATADSSTAVTRRIRVPRIDYPQDVARIVRALFDAGYSATPAEAEELWSLYSETLCAGWLTLPSEEHATRIVELLEPFIEISNR